MVFFGDIKQAFLNIEVAIEDRDAMYFLWVDNVLGDDLQVVPYRFNRVIFGAGPSPFLLTGTIRHHFAKYSEVDPDFVEQVKNGFFVDDLASGARTVGEEFALYLKTKGRMAEGGFIMRKWKTNSTQLMEEIQEAEMGRGTVEEQEKDASYVQQNSGDHLGSGEKILGLQRDRENDEFKFTISKLAEMAEELPVNKRGILSTTSKFFELPVNKRGILSTTSKFFDPLGIVGPVMVMAKLIFQDACRLEVGCDDVLPEDLERRWVKWLNEMAAVTDIKVDRCVYKSLEEETLSVFLHGFGDASKKAYCAALYLVMHQPSGMHSKLLTSYLLTRIAPLKEESVPRLELVSARILVQLVSTVGQALQPKLNFEKTVPWLDSMTALLWIRNNGEWKQFVRQRVDET